MIETPRLRGSISLKGGQIDDLALTQYRETVDPNSPPIVLLSPSGSPHPFYAEFGWVGGSGRTGEGARRQHRLDAAGRRARSASASRSRSPGTTAKGSTFRRTISVDDKYLFTVEDQVENKSAAPVALYPYRR